MSKEARSNTAITDDGIGLGLTHQAHVTLDGAASVDQVHAGLVEAVGPADPVTREGVSFDATAPATAPSVREVVHLRMSHGSSRFGGMATLDGAIEQREDRSRFDGYAQISLRSAGNAIWGAVLLMGVPFIIDVTIVTSSSRSPMPLPAAAALVIIVGGWGGFHLQFALTSPSKLLAKILSTLEAACNGKATVELVPKGQRNTAVLPPPPSEQ